MATQLATTQPDDRAMTPIGEVQARVVKMGNALKSVLPSHIDIAKFQRVVMTAVMNDPDLLNANRQSLYNSITKAAQDGLLPDKREGALVIFKGQVQWMPMVAGVLKKVRQSGEVSSITAHAVYENDKFAVLYGDDDRIVHEPTEGAPGKIKGAYCIVTLKDGYKVREYMPWWRIEKAKAVARTKTVWEAWPDEMAIKTVIKHIAKLLPQSTDIEAAFERDDTAQYDGSAAMLSGPQTPPVPLTGAALIAQASEDDGAGEPATSHDEGDDGSFARADGREGYDLAGPGAKAEPPLIERISNATTVADLDALAAMIPTVPDEATDAADILDLQEAERSARHRLTQRPRRG